MTNRIITKETFTAWDTNELIEYREYVKTQPDNLVNQHILNVVNEILEQTI